MDNVTEGEYMKEPLMGCNLFISDRGRHNPAVEKADSTCTDQPGEPKISAQNISLWEQVEISGSGRVLWEQQPTPIRDEHLTLIPNSGQKEGPLPQAH